MKKLLHERLREIADEKEDEPYSSGIIEALCKEFGVCENKSSYAVDLNNFLKAIADEIEKYYIPRPRFDDGEPVQFDCEVEGCNGLVGAMLIFRDGSGYVYGREDNPFPESLCGAPIEYGLERPSDSFEKLLVDLRGAGDFIPSKEYLKHLADRITAIMERDA